MRALIADEDGIVRTLMRILLKDAGFDQRIDARNGKEAFAYLKAEPADLIISDWSLPEMDGLALLKACKGDPLLKNIPFVMSSGRDEKSEMRQALDAGADAYVVKPFVINELEDILNKVRLKARRKSMLLPP